MHSFSLDWKIIATLGATGIVGILVIKVDGEAAERVLIHGIDAVRDICVACKKAS